jgi:hypothetical protein
VDGLRAHVTDREGVHRDPLNARLADARGARTRVERLDLARARTSVSIDGACVVALLEPTDNAVATRLRGAGSARGRVSCLVDGALPAAFNLASGGAAVGGRLVAVVALLGAFDLAVVAGGRYAQRTERRALVPDLYLAAAGAAVEGQLVAVFAGLGALDGAVTAKHLVAECSGRADPAGLYLAVDAAAVAGELVLVVALLGAGDETVAALRGNTGFTRGLAVVAGF